MSTLFSPRKPQVSYTKPVPLERTSPLRAFPDGADLICREILDAAATLRWPSAIFHRALLGAGNDAQLVVFEALPHAFWYHFQLPETKEALELMAKFFRREGWRREKQTDRESSARRF